MFGVVNTDINSANPDKLFLLSKAQVTCPSSDFINKRQPKIIKNSEQRI